MKLIQRLSAAMKAGPRGRKPQAVVFIDLEHWYFSMANLYHSRPDYRAWREELSKQYQVTQIQVFADFSIPALSRELPRLREITNVIVETTNTSARFRKDFTDFIMLDAIYQTAMEKSSAPVFILVTGDGHFSSAVSCLVNRCHKEVGVFGVKGALSRQLQNVSTWNRELDASRSLEDYYGMVAENFYYLESQKGQKPVFPTFLTTAEAVARRNQLPVGAVKKALSQMLDEGYLRQREQAMGQSDRVRLLEPVWRKLVEDGYWEYQEGQRIPRR